MKKKLSIFRIENNKKEGCYRNNWECAYRRKMTNKHDRNKRKYPIPEEDIGICRSIKTNEICGFLNLEQVYNWFCDEELIILEKLGYNLKKIKVQKITAIGEKQVLAIR